MVLVHGTTADRTRWDVLLPELTRHFTVYAVDRRGRGDSGDHPDYSIEREFEDIAGVVRAAGNGAYLLGHSFGALCALEAAARTGTVAKLVLYEPYFPVDGVPGLYADGDRARLEALVVEGDREKLLSTFMTDFVGMSAGDLCTMRADPSWRGRLAAAHTLVREMDEDTYVFEVARFRNLRSRTLLLLGELSPPTMSAPSRLLASVIPATRTIVLPGQGHGAISMAPDLFLKEVVGFLRG